MHVMIHHNISDHAMINGYRVGDDVVVVAEYDVEVADPDRAAIDVSVLEDAFDRFNVGDDPLFTLAQRVHVLNPEAVPVPPGVDTLAFVYRQRKNRSLSVGDVVEIDGRAYACAKVGWTRLQGPLHKVRRIHAGSMPLHAFD